MAGAYAIAWGNRLFGKVDKVPGKYHVATRCWHFCYLPLFPLGSFLVLEESMHGMTNVFRGVRIPFSWKSLFVAWSRTLLTVPFFFGWFGVIVELTVHDANKSPWLDVVLFACGSTLLLFGPYLIPGIGRATANRASELATYALQVPAETPGILRRRPGNEASHG